VSGVQQRAVARDEDGMRLDRWFSANFPHLPFSRLQKLIRTGQVRVDKGRAKPSTRLASGQIVRVPPIQPANPNGSVLPEKVGRDEKFLRSILLHEDREVFVFNKPHGLAVQGGSGTKRHLDGMLGALAAGGDRPRLVHRLDRDTSGCILVARTAAAARHFGKVFGSRSARKIYWAITARVPRPPQGRISCFLAKGPTADGEQMRVVENGAPGAQHSVTHYSVIDDAGGQFGWISLKPVTGRTHQLRVHLAELGTPILSDPRYFNIENWEAPAGLARGLHLHARRLSVPLRSGKVLDVTAPLPEHMGKTFEALGFDAGRFDAIDLEPEDDA